jgi:hypothetical protein
MIHAVQAFTPVRSSTLALGVVPEISAYSPQVLQKSLCVWLPEKPCTIVSVTVFAFRNLQLEFCQCG